MKKLILLKLGGSLVTDKTKPFTLMEKSIDKIVYEIKGALEQDPEINLLIGTGTGSFGHYSAEQYNLQEGLQSEKQIYGFCSVHSSAMKPNQIVVTKLLDEGLKAFSIHPSSMIVARDGSIISFFHEAILQILAKGMMPVTHGDVIIDETKGVYICSVENIFSELVKKIFALKIYQCINIQAGITDGVLDENSNTIPLITNSTYFSLQSLIYPAKGYDVTGGMKSKIESCLQMAKYGIESLIINGTTKGTIKKALLGKEVRGTRVKL